MNEKQIQRAVSADGTEIVGRVVGQGPALVLVHGGIGHGDLAWEALAAAAPHRPVHLLPPEHPGPRAIGRPPRPHPTALGRGRHSLR